MVTRATRLKNIAFLLITVLVLGYLGARYADLGHLVGLRGYYVVKVELPETGGSSPTPTSPTGACRSGGSDRSG